MRSASRSAIAGFRRHGLLSSEPSDTVTPAWKKRQTRKVRGAIDSKTPATLLLIPLIRAAINIAIGVMVVMLMAALISGINKSVAGVFESIAPRTFLVWRFFQAGVTVSDGSEESSPWRRNPAIADLEADRIRLLPSVRYVTRREESPANVEFGSLRLESVQISGLSAEWVEVNGGDVYPGRPFTPAEDGLQIAVWRA